MNQNTYVNPASRTNLIKYAIRDIFNEVNKLKAKGMEILPLNIGDPVNFGFKTPPHLTEAYLQAIRDHKFNYAPSEGLIEARIAISNFYQNKGINTSSDDVFITNGVSEGVHFALTALIEPGQSVLVPYPGYPLYDSVLGELIGVSRPYYLDESKGWRIDIDQLESQIDSNTRGIVVINPHNPTGRVFSEEELLSVINIARKHKLVIFSDEIYDELILNRDGSEIKMVHLAKLTTDVPVVTFNGLSKNFCLPGVRVGWMVFHNSHLMKEYQAAILKLANIRLCAPTPQQHLIKPALEGTQLHFKKYREELQKRATVCSNILSKTKLISKVDSQAAFYEFPSFKLPKKFKNDFEFVIALLRETGVLVVPGMGFGQKNGTSHFRIVFLPETAILSTSLEKIVKFLEEN